MQDLWNYHDGIILNAERRADEINAVMRFNSNDQIELVILKVVEQNVRSILGKVHFSFGECSAETRQKMGKVN